MFVRNEMIDLLRYSVCTVVFTKADGSTRTMNCSLNSRDIPEEAQPKTDGNLKENLEVIKVYDVDAKGWRSFKVESVQSFTPML